LAEMRRLICICMLASFACISMNAKDYILNSPDGSISVKVVKNEKPVFSISKDGNVLVGDSRISMTFGDGEIFGAKEKVSRVKYIKEDRTVTSNLYRKARIQDKYNEMILSFRKGDLVFRAYDEGVAYRFISRMKGAGSVVNEQADYVFPQDWESFVPYVSRKSDKPFEEQLFNSFENVYEKLAFSSWNPHRLAFLPVTVCAGDYKICITETDLHDYPGMYLHKGDETGCVKAYFAAAPKKVHQGGHNKLQLLVDEREDYIASVGGAREFPWRVFEIARNDRELLDCDMPWLLAKEARGDFSWVKPGKVAWDWWNGWNLYGVDFEAGINNDTYKYYIDFASKNGIEYVILDEGWAVNLQADLLRVIPEINIPELCDYAKERGVGLILWAGYLAFDRDMDNVCRHYSEMGIKGFKVDFMDRDDQEVVRFYERAAQTAAKYHLVLDFHGAFKPIGLQRQYPNVLNHEGVYGLEQRKWDTSNDQVLYDVTIPFTRLVAGPADYTQGAMRNATKKNFRAVHSEPMSQGTRCHQLAEYVVFDSPLNMLCDSPSNYLQEKECLDFIASCPVVWDETVPIAGEIAEYVAVAKRKGDIWYVAALNNWTEREMTMDLSFIGEGKYQVEEFKDGINASRAARDYKRMYGAQVDSSSKIEVKLAPGGGWVAILRPCGN